MTAHEAAEPPRPAAAPVTPERRLAIIADLEAHFRRELAATIKGALDLTYVAQNEKWEHCHRKAAEVLLPMLAEHERILMGVRQVPDHLLEDYYRHWTLPNWNRLMEEAGLEWSERWHSWQPIDRDRTKDP